MDPVRKQKCFIVSPNKNLHYQITELDAESYNNLEPKNQWNSFNPSKKVGILGMKIVYIAYYLLSSLN